jgi:hypothetical protein
LQRAIASTVGRPFFAALDALDPAIMEAANHERDANAGRAFIEVATRAEKALFLAKLLLSYGLGADRVDAIHRELGLGAAPEGDVPAAGDKEVIFLGDLLYVEGLGAASLSPLLTARLARADRLVINLEGVIGDHGNELFPFQSRRGLGQLLRWNEGDGSGWVIRFARGELAELLRGLPPVTFTLANNHSLDEGRAGLERTIASLSGLADHAGAGHPGNGCNDGASALVDLGGVTLGLTCIGFGSNHAPTSCGLRFTGVPYELPTDALRRQLERLCEADYRVALAHWGYEHEHWPRADQLRCTRELWELGYDAVVGHHPHIVQPTLADARRLVAFSLGDFVGGDRTVFGRFAQALSLRFSPGRAPSVEVLPMVQTPWFEAQRTMLLDEAPLAERRVWERVFVAKLRSGARAAA